MRVFQNNLRVVRLFVYLFPYQPQKAGEMRQAWKSNAHVAKRFNPYQPRKAGEISIYGNDDGGDDFVSIHTSPERLVKSGQ
ncbi:MAG: hypothetical protein RL368_855 [Pseudomonadota bacterium]